ncbi:MAG: DUF418 domain-containing protein [Acidobacteria bacterium]|nr:DUF418 domain-containing protein [Acidobacteriota bacterium]
MRKTNGEYNPPVTTCGPVRPSERVPVLDIVRGFAIFGILLINVQFYSHPVRAIFDLRGGTLSPTDGWVISITSFLVSEKFFSILALLFGIGMAITFDRARERNGPFLSLYLRRLAGLFLIGISHALLFYAGDYIGNYALLGVVLLAFCYLRPAVVLTAGLAVLLVPVLMMAPYVLQRPAAGPPARAEQVQKREKMRQERTRQYIQENVQVYGRGSVTEIFRLRYQETISQYQSLLYVGWKLLAMLLLGLWCWKKGLVRSLKEHLGLVRRAMWVSLTVGLAGNALSLYGILSPSRAGPVLGLLEIFGQEIGAPALGLFYAAGIVLLHYGGRWKTVLGWFAPVGRTAMSNYIFQSVVCTTLFYAYGFGLYYRTSYAVNLLLAVALFGAQIVLSRLWLRRFDYGPLEWLLRAFMYRGGGVAVHSTMNRIS